MRAAGDNDDRVPSFHSYKFAAALQHTLAQYWGSQQTNPIFLGVQEHIGHAGEHLPLEMFPASMHACMSEQLSVKLNIGVACISV